MPSKDVVSDIGKQGRGSFDRFGAPKYIKKGRNCPLQKLH
jgi:hypothetical protein